MDEKPHLNFIVLCQNFDFSPGQPPNLIGVINQAVVKTVGPESLDINFDIAVAIRLVTVLRGCRLDLRIQLPDGTERVVVSDLVDSRPNEHAWIGRYEMTMQASMFGTHWFRIYLDSEFLGQTSMDVVALSDQDGHDAVDWPVFL